MKKYIVAQKSFSVKTTIIEAASSEEALEKAEEYEEHYFWKLEPGQIGLEPSFLVVGECHYYDKPMVEGESVKE